MLATLNNVQVLWPSADVQCARLFSIMNSDHIRLVIIDDEQLFSGMLRTWLTRFRDVEVLGCANDGEAGWELCHATQPDLAIVDIQMPKVDGLDLVERLARECPKLRLLTMSGLLDPATIWRVMQSGVHGFVSKTQPPEDLIEAIRMVARGNTFFGAAFGRVKAELLAQPDSFQKILSDREQQVLRAVAIGRADENIGTELGISPATVEAHRKRIRQKLSLHNDRDLLAYARQWGLDVQTVTAG
jgi:DNA-binding NarL/FixJ family response regulator